MGYKNTAKAGNGDMGTTVLFKPTTVQKKAISLLKGGTKHILLFDGSRSGKTTVLVMAIIYRALRFARSRHLICRYRAKDARSSVLRETLLPWLNNTIGVGGYTYLAHENMVTLFNRSEIWIGGLGDREQADKILGHEYNTIYFLKIAWAIFLPFNFDLRGMAEQTGAEQSEGYGAKRGSSPMPLHSGARCCDYGRACLLHNYLHSVEIITIEICLQFRILELLVRDL
jgi:hypothetical protein